MAAAAATSDKLHAAIHESSAEYLDASQDHPWIVGYSGGKDSTYQLWYIVRQLKMKPLVERFDHGFYRPQLEDNNKRTFKLLDQICAYDLLPLIPSDLPRDKQQRAARRHKHTVCIAARTTERFRIDELKSH